jgi:hypothetical protein
MDTGNPIVDAQSAFNRERRRERIRRLAHRLHLRPEGQALMSLDSTPAGRRRPLGVRSIRLESIVGTTEPQKARAFGRDFRPPAASRRRWESLWLAERRGAPVPPITVYRVGDEHYVDDGHHRVSVAHALGMASIDAEVTELAPA